MSLSADEIAAVAAELRPLTGWRVEAVRATAERALVLGMHDRSGAAAILLSAEPDLTRVHAASERPRTPPQPTPFQAAARRELEGARLAAIEVLAGDRVVTLAFERDGRRRALVAELTGRHGNLLLLDEAGLVLGAAGRNLSQRRELGPGRRYQPPAARPAEEARPPRFTPVQGAPFPLSAAIEAHYAGLEAARRLLEARRRLRQPLRAAVERAGRALARLADEAARVPQAEADRRVADLVKANLHAIRRGAREAVLTEWTVEGPRQVRVALDPALGPRENMERYYRRFRRIAESAARVEARAAEVRRRLEATRAILRAVEGAPLETLPRLEREARRLGAGPRPEAPRRRRREGAALPWLRFRSLTGAEILVGRSAEGNDALTLRAAHGNDPWLHARGRAGAHVVLRLARGQAPDQQSLLDAAHLAAHFSDARGESMVDVSWTRAKHVRKPRGAAPGAVTISQERTIALRLEPERLERLLASEEGGVEAAPPAGGRRPG